MLEPATGETLASRRRVSLAGMSKSVSDVIKFVLGRRTFHLAGEIKGSVDTASI